MLKKYCVIGNDKRSLNLKKIYKDEGKNLVDYKDADIIIGSIPFREDNLEIDGKNLSFDSLIKSMKQNNSRLYAGAISNSVTDKLNNEGVIYLDVLKQEGIAIKNAIPTAEGAISTIINNTDFTIHNSNILILGFGNIGKVLAKMLYGMGAKVFCEARNKKDIALIDAMGYNSVNLVNLDKYLEKMSVIINTIPAVILDKERLDKIKNTSVILDLASKPGGVDFDYANKLGIKVIWALSLPSKIAPKSAAMYIKEAIDEIEKERE